MHCLYCEQSIQGRKSRKFCNDAHKQAYWRKRHQAETSETELVHLRTQLEQARAQIAELELENMRLLKKLDIEHRYHADTQAHTFKAWLKKQPAPSPFIHRLLALELFPVRGSRGTYETYLNKLKCSDEEWREFEHLWKAMLLA